MKESHTHQKKKTELNSVSLKIINNEKSTSAEMFLHDNKRQTKKSGNIMIFEQLNFLVCSYITGHHA